MRGNQDAKVDEEAGEKSEEREAIINTGESVNYDNKGNKYNENDGKIRQILTGDSRIFRQ